MHIYLRLVPDKDVLQYYASMQAFQKIIDYL